VKFAVVALLAACSKAPDPCVMAFHGVQSLAFGGAPYAGPPALMFGMACPELTGDDFTCLGAVKTREDLDRCDHAARAIGSRVGGEGSASPTLAADLARLADEVCACEDTDCILGVGQKEHAFDLPRVAIDPKDPAKQTETRLKECLKKARLSPGSSAR
jgi:hypothetical protein